MSNATKFQWALNLGFALAFASAFFSNAAHCNPEKGIVVPWGFYVTFVLFMSQWLYVMSLHKNGYNIVWQQSEKKQQELFEAQTERFAGTMGFLAKWHLVEIILGVVLAHRNITCVNEGKSWAYGNFVGSIFFILHVIGTSMATGMIRAVFIKTAKAQGWWLSDDDLVDDNAKADDAKKKN